MITLYFTREFTGGNLKGLFYNATMTFATTDEAVKFVERGKRGIKSKFGSPYKIVDYSFQKYWRY
jgi:hypothetical protein